LEPVRKPPAYLEFTPEGFIRKQLESWIPEGSCPVRDRIFIAFEIADLLPKSREGRNIDGKHIMTKGALGRILDNYTVPTGLRNAFLGLSCYKFFVPNGTKNRIIHKSWMMRPGFRLFPKTEQGKVFYFPF
jgi:hypothetical protein